MVAARGVTSANRTEHEPFHSYLVTSGPQKTVLSLPKGKVIFRQGEPADSAFFIQKGRVKISVTSLHGKEATLALHGKSEFFGEECIITSQPVRSATAVAILPCIVLRVDRKELLRALDEDKSLASVFQSFLLNRCVLMQADLIDHLFNSSEKRLARALLLLSKIEDGTEATIPHTTQETLAEMVGTTRSRISVFMNRFRKLGYIQYKGSSYGVKVHSSLFNILLQE